MRFNSPKPFFCDLYAYSSIWRTFFLVFFCVGFNQSGAAQRDTLFWFVAPEVANSHGDRPILFRFAAYGQAAAVTVDQPANPTFPMQSFTVPSSGSFTLDVTPWIDSIENKPPDQVLNFGFRIRSSQPISVYYEVNPTCQCNPDIFTLKGKNALGTQFILPFQNYLNNASYARSRFDIVATQPNTQITLLPTRDLVGRPANIPFTITLQAGQTYSGTAASFAANQHPAGSIVSSNHPIAITLSDDSVEGTPYGGCRDVLGDQAVPVSIVGDEYIVVKGYLNGPDKVYILSTLPGTVVTIDGVPAATLNFAQTYEYTLTNPVAYITASAPVYVLHMSGFGCELGEALLPPIKCTGSDEAAFVRSTNEFFALNILVEAGGESGFSLNGNTGLIHTGQFSVVPNSNNQWMYAQIDLTANITPGVGNRLVNTGHRFHVGLIHGSGTRGCRYGYFSDYAQYAHTILSPPDTICEGAPILLNADVIAGASYVWSGPNGFGANGVQVQVNPAAVSSSGNYVVSGFVGTCPVKPDTVFMWVQPTPPVPQLSHNAPLCVGGNLLLSSNYQGSGTYAWSGPNGLTDSSAALYIPSVQAFHSGTYSLQISENNCSGPLGLLSVAVEPVHFNPIALAVCPGDSMALGSGWYSAPGVYYDSLYAVTGCDSVTELTLAWHPTYSVAISDSICAGNTYTLPDGVAVSQPGLYTIKLSTVQGCDSVFTVFLSVPDTFQVMVSQEICMGDSALMPDGTFRGQTGSWTFPFVSQAGCDSLVTAQLLVHPVWNTSVQAAICPGDTFFLQDGQAITSAGNYVVTLSSFKGCDSLISTELTLLPVFSSVQTVTLCAGESFTLPDGHMVNQTGEFSSIVQALNGCDSTVISHVSFAPLHDMSEVLIICSGDSVYVGGDWQKDAGIYLSIYASVYGCDSLVSSELRLRPLPESFLPPDTAICESGYSVHVPGFSFYSWDSGSTSSSAQINQPGAYVLSVRDSMGCVGTDTLEVKNSCPPTLYVPSAFTVNSDGINEVFRAYGTRIVSFEMQIFSRWGERIFHSVNIEQGWDGMQMGNPLPIGVYVYRIDVLFEGSIENPEPVFGKVVLLR